MEMGEEEAVVVVVVAQDKGQMEPEVGPSVGLWEVVEEQQAAEVAVARMQSKRKS